jgi:hypothetical protein
VRVAAMVRASDVDICWESFGVPGDPALLLISGLGAQMISWDVTFANGWLATDSECCD